MSNQRHTLVQLNGFCSWTDATIVHGQAPRLAQPVSPLLLSAFIYPRTVNVPSSWQYSWMPTQNKWNVSTNPEFFRFPVPKEGKHWYFIRQWITLTEELPADRAVTAMKTRPHIPMAKDPHCSHKAQHTSGLTLRKWRCSPQVKPVKMSRIRCRIFKGSWRAGERFPGPVAAQRYRGERDSRKAGAKGALQWLSLALHLPLRVLSLCSEYRLSLCAAALIPPPHSQWPCPGVPLEHDAPPAPPGSSWSYFSWCWHLPRPHSLLTHATWLFINHLLPLKTCSIIRTDLFWE